MITKFPVRHPAHWVTEEFPQSWCIVLVSYCAGSNDKCIVAFRPGRIVTLEEKIEKWEAFTQNLL